MKKICLDISNCGGLGDTIAATPVIRKLYESYNSKISIITLHPEVFQNNPYVDNIWANNTENLDNIIVDYEKLHSFTPNIENIYRMSLRHNCFDIRQYHASGLGFQLLPSEMNMNFYPKAFEEIEDLPEKYILIHPVQTWKSRTWDVEKWNSLIEMFNQINIPVVAVGKSTIEYGNGITDKPVFDVKISNGLNLLNKTSLSQTWWLIQKSMCFITMDSGLLHLAGTTDAEIIQLGSSINYKLRAPYRNGSQEYKYTYVGGGCNISCASDMRYGVQHWDTIRGVPPLSECLEDKTSFECHPNTSNVYIQVFNKIKNLS
jgi:ADP-heptose:LPS heptosyltransferase